MKWYVFDEADCFGTFNSAAEAAKQADWLVAQGFSGIEIRCLSTEQFNHYCKFGTLT